jgi:hypothetical protein
MHRGYPAAHFCPNRGVVERRVGDQRDLLTRLRVAQVAAQRFALAGGGEWVEPVAVTVAAAAVNYFETGGIDGLHEQVRSYPYHANAQPCRNVRRRGPVGPR